MSTETFIGGRGPVGIRPSDGDWEDGWIGGPDIIGRPIALRIRHLRGGNHGNQTRND